MVYAILQISATKPRTGAFFMPFYDGYKMGMPFAGGTLSQSQT